MNCKQGDLAVFVHSTRGNEGGFVRIVAPDNLRGGYWYVELLSSLKSKSGYTGLPGSFGYAPDAKLRPVRDGEGEDETLTWAKKPEKVTA